MCLGKLDNFCSGTGWSLFCLRNMLINYMCITCFVLITFSFLPLPHILNNFYLEWKFSCSSSSFPLLLSLRQCWESSSVCVVLNYLPGITNNTEEIGRVGQLGSSHRVMVYKQLIENLGSFNVLLVNKTCSETDPWTWSKFLWVNLYIIIRVNLP